MKRIVIINNNDRALTYGIGTYTTNLVECLKKTEYLFDIVYLNSDKYELNIIDKEVCRDVFVPAFADSTSKKSHAYCQMLPYLFRELFNEDDFIIFHFNYFITDYLIAQLRRVFDCKILFTVHFTHWSFSLNGNFRELRSLLEKKEKKQNIIPFEQRIIDSIKVDSAIFQQTDFILFVAQHTADTYSKISLLQDLSYTIVNNGLKDIYRKLSSDKRAAIRKRYHIKKDEIILFFAGRLDEIKGIYCLIEAFKKVLRINPTAHLFVAGEGDFLKLLAKSRFDCTKISWLGFLDQSELYNFYSIADIGIACSIHEEFGLVALEMMMHKLPVIVTNTSGLAEIIDDNINGLKVSVIYRQGKQTVNIYQLAKKISFLIDNPNERKRLGDNARKKFLANYELSHFSDKMIQIYNSISLT